MFIISLSTGAANGGQHHHHINHPLLTPTSPRSVTTASMSASGKWIAIFFITLYILFGNVRWVMKFRIFGAKSSNPTDVNCNFSSIMKSESGWATSWPSGRTTYNGCDGFQKILGNWLVCFILTHFIYIYIYIHFKCGLCSNFYWIILWRSGDSIEKWTLIPWLWLLVC